MKKVLSVLLSFFCAAFIFANEIHVTVVDVEIDIPLEGVTLTLSNKSAGPWETDFNGECTIIVDDFSSSVILQAYLPGYAVKKVKLSEKDTEITIPLSIEDVMEGKELVVEKEAYQKADAESGVSVALTKDQIQTTSLIGVIPDVMSTVKTLPGVAYAGAFSQQPSIRGSYPYETACVFDGMYVLQPYHWSGAVSIFDPLMVDSVKLSHGIFSAQYGHATAALLDVNSVNPVGDTVKVNASISSVQTDIYGQVPITDTFGTVLGLRMSYMNTVPWLYDTIGLTKKLSRGVIDKFSDYIRMPYMYDYYLKMFYTPNDRLTFGANGFLGLEGLGAQLATNTPEEEQTDPGANYRNYYKDYYYNYYLDTVAKWDNIFGFAALNAKWLPVDNFQLVFDSSYNIYNNTIKVILDSRTDEKLTFYEYDITQDKDNLFHSESVNNNYFEYINIYYIQLLQGKTAGSYQLDDLNLFSIGVEELFQTKTYETKQYSNFSYDSLEWWDYEKKPEYPPPEPDETNYHNKLDGNRILNSVGYSFWEFGNDSSKLKGELGLRFEHYLLTREDDKIRVSSLPYFNPRATIQWTPVRYGDFFDKVTFSAGTGIFTKMVDSTMDLTTDYALSRDNIKPDRNVFGLIGAEVDFLDNLSFQTEAYYKYYMNRFYTVKIPTGEYDENFNEICYYNAYSNGTGHVAGFDMMLHKKSGRHLDGYLCYSFIFSKYNNPTTVDKKYDVDKTEGGDPLGIWYYPYFHRFHTFNAVLNYRPVTAVTMTLSGGITSGAPCEVYNEALGKYVYSNTERYSPVYPVNFRLAFSNYAFSTKLKWELYLGVENILGLLNKSSVMGAIIYEDELNVTNIANFDTGIPTFSVGFRLSY